MKPSDSFVLLQTMEIAPEQFRAIACEVSDFLKQLANEQRLIILCHLADGEKSVRELQHLLGLDQSSTSQHLARLRKQGIIQARRDSQSNYYSICDDKVFQVIQLLHEIYCSDPETSPGSSQL